MGIRQPARFVYASTGNFSRWIAKTAPFSGRFFCAISVVMSFPLYYESTHSGAIATISVIAERYGFVVTDHLPTAKNMPFLLWQGQRLSLHQTPQDQKGYAIDYNAPSLQHRLSTSTTRSHIARAIGIKPHLRPCVVDASAGWGRDALTLASLGCQVQMIERHPVLAALLENALERLPDGSTLRSPLQLYYGDVRDFLEKTSPCPVPDVIYFDPMFPERKKSAKVKKHMQLFHTLIGDDEDASDVVKVLLNHARYRLVVKRPRLAPALTATPPHHQIAGKTVRYDVYVNARMSEGLGVV